MFLAYFVSIACGVVIWFVLRLLLCILLYLLKACAVLARTDSPARPKWALRALRGASHLTNGRCECVVNVPGALLRPGFLPTRYGACGCVVMVLQQSCSSTYWDLLGLVIWGWLATLVRYGLERTPNWQLTCAHLSGLTVRSPWCSGELLLCYVFPLELPVPLNLICYGIVLAPCGWCLRFSLACHCHSQYALTYS